MAYLAIRKLQEPTEAIWNEEDCLTLYRLSRWHTSDSCGPNQQDGSRRFLCKLKSAHGWVSLCKLSIYEEGLLNEKSGGNYARGANDYDYRMSNWSVLFSLGSRGGIENPWMTFAVNSDRAGMDRYTSKLSPAVDYGAGTFLLVVGKWCFSHCYWKIQARFYIFYLNDNPLNYI